MENRDQEPPVKKVNNVIHQFLNSEEGDDFCFKPITKGLGFHHENKRRTAKLELRNATTAPSSHAARPVKKESPGHSFFTSTKLLNTHTSLESSIPKTQVPRASNASSFVSKILAPKNEVAPLWIEAASLILDTIIVASSVIFLDICMGFIAFSDALGFFTKLKFIDLLVFDSILFVLFHSFYFTIMDINGTLGKLLLKIKLVQRYGGPVELKHTFTRSVIVLLSSLVIFVPLLFDFQGKLSDTKIVKR